MTEFNTLSFSFTKPLDETQEKRLIRSMQDIREAMKKRRETQNGFMRLGKEGQLYMVEYRMSSFDKVIIKNPHILNRIFPYMKAITDSVDKVGMKAEGFGVGMVLKNYIKDIARTIQAELDGEIKEGSGHD